MNQHFLQGLGSSRFHLPDCYLVTHIYIVFVQRFLYYRLYSSIVLQINQEGQVMLQESSPILARRRRFPSAVLLFSFTILQLLFMAVAFLGGYFWRDGNLPEFFL